MATPSKPLALLALLTLTCLSVAFAKTGQLKFPTDNPTVTIDFPEGWSCKPDKEGTLVCDPGDDSGYAYSIIALKDIETEKDVRAALRVMLKAMADEAKVKDFAMGEVESDKNGNDVRFIGQTGDGKVEGTDFVVMVHAFEAKKGKWYAIVTAGSASAGKKHEKQYDSITTSINPLD